MFPEPETGGNGGTPAPVEDKGTENTPTTAPDTTAPASTDNNNPLDFTQFMGAGQEDNAGEPSTPEPEVEYTLGFTEDDGIDAEDADFFTSKAKEFNLPADGATEFIRSIGNMLAERESVARKEELSALRSEWGKDFDAKSKKVGGYMGRVFNQMGLTPEQAANFATASHYRLFHHLMQRSAEPKTVNTPVALTPEQESSQLKNLVRQHVQMKSSNDSDGAAQVAAAINAITMKKYGYKAY